MAKGLVSPPGSREQPRDDRDREYGVNGAPTVEAEVEVVIERMVGRAFIACLKTWINLITLLVVGSVTLWGPVLWRWLFGNGGGHAR